MGSGWRTGDHSVLRPPSRASIRDIIGSLLPVNQAMTRWVHLRRAAALSGNPPGTFLIFHGRLRGRITELSVRRMNGSADSANAKWIRRLSKDVGCDPFLASAPGPVACRSEGGDVHQHLRADGWFFVYVNVFDPAEDGAWVLRAGLHLDGDARGGETGTWCEQ